MNDEDLRKTIEFIIEQQAQFAADIQQLREAREAQAAEQARTDDRLTQVESVVVRLSDLVKRAVDTTEKVMELQQRSDPTLSGLTDRLNALIDAVERIIAREGGQPPAEGGVAPGA